MNRLLELYLYKAIWPLIAIVGASIVVLMLVLWGVSLVEARADRVTVFDLELRLLGNAPLWVLLLAGLLVINGIVMARWAVASADVGRRRIGCGYEVNLPIPAGKLVAVNIFYIGIAVLLFYAARGTV